MRRRPAQVERDGEEEGVGKVIPSKERKEGGKDGTCRGDDEEEKQGVKVKNGLGWTVFGV